MKGKEGTRGERGKGNTTKRFPKGKGYWTVALRNKRWVGVKVCTILKYYYDMKIFRD